MLVPLARVLLVDDEPLLLRVTSILLQQHGCDVVTADDARRALTVVRDQPLLDLAVVDYSLPELNGNQLIALMREVRPDLRFILASGYLLPESEIPRDCTFLMKPVPSERLVETIRNVVGISV